jgi:hypothetical protein
MLSRGVFERLERSRVWVITIGLVSLGIALFLSVASVFVALSTTAALDHVTLALMGFFFACLYLTPALYLLRYGRAIARATKEPGTATLERALRLNLRYFRFVGLSILVGLVGGVLLGLAAVHAAAVG